MQQGDWGADVNLSVDPEESPGGGCEEVWEKYVFGLTLIDYIFDIFLGYIFIIKYIFVILWTPRFLTITIIRNKWNL